MTELYAMKEFDLYVGEDCHHCEVLLSNMNQKDHDRCTIINVDDPNNLDSAIRNNITMVPCLVADGVHISGASAILNYLKTH